MSPTLTLAVGLGGLFLGLVLLVSTVAVQVSQRQQVGRSLAAIDTVHALPDALRREADPPFQQRVTRPLLAALARLGRRYTPAGKVDRLTRQLELAGSPAHWDADRLLAGKMLGLLVGSAVGLAVPLLLGAGTLKTVLAAVALGALGLFAPEITLSQLGAKRQQQLRKDLPDALDMLSISVEAGLGFDAALAQVARNTTGPLAEEFFRVLHEMQIGMGRMQALRAFGERTTVPEARGFVSAMVQADGFGIPISNVLRVQAKELRLKRSQRAEEQAQKVPVKILFPLIFCIMPALFVIIIGPAAISIVHNFAQH